MIKISDQSNGLPSTWEADKPFPIRFAERITIRDLKNTTDFFDIEWPERSFHSFVNTNINCFNDCVYFTKLEMY